MTIDTKAEMYGLYERGRFGNRLKTWPSVSAFINSGFDKPVVLRYKGKGGGANYPYYGVGLSGDGVLSVVDEWVRLGADPSKIVLNELADDSRLLIQGEIQRSTDYLDLRYSRVPAPMRVALATEQHHASGLVALTILKESIDPASMDDLWELLNDYPDSVIEFSVWKMNVGDMARRNTVFWEVRNY